MVLVTIYLLVLHILALQIFFSLSAMVEGHCALNLARAAGSPRRVSPPNEPPALQQRWAMCQSLF